MTPQEISQRDAGSAESLRAHPIVFYDGECALCHGFVQWLIARDRARQFRFAPLQGETAARTIGSPQGDTVHWTVILLDEDGRHERSDAALRILRHLGGPWKLMRLFRIVPRFLRDGIYRFIARHRFGWFGKADSCRLPTPDEQTHFLP